MRSWPRKTYQIKKLHFVHKMTVVKIYFSTLLTLRTTKFWCVKKGALREHWLHRFHFLINCSHKGLISKTTHLLKGSNHGTEWTTMKQWKKVSIHVPWKYVKRLYNILGLCLWHVQTYWRSDRRPENLSFGDFILLGKSLSSYSLRWGKRKKHNFLKRMFLDSQAAKTC